jgi:peptidoglycan hydrolase CwlO-like protein
LTVEVGVLVSVLMLIIAYLGYQLNKQKETKADSRQDAKLQTQLEYISKGVDDIRIDLKANEKQIGMLGERVTRVEESAKQAHKRIDKLEKGED